jgi:hypothetical protein
MATRRSTRDEDEDEELDEDEDDDDDDIEVLVFRGKGAKNAINEWFGISRHPTAANGNGPPARRRPASSGGRDRSPRRQSGYFG